MIEANTAQPCDTESGNICIQCGLCCDGSMFGHAIVNKNDDMTFLKQMGFEFFADHDKLVFHQPCLGLEGKLCQLYNDARRFNACKKFRCRLLKQYNSKKISYHYAMDVIEKIMMRRPSIKEFSKILHTDHNSSEQSICSFIRELELSGRMADLSFRRTYSKQILDCLAFEELLKREFYNENSKTPEYYER